MEQQEINNNNNNLGPFSELTDGFKMPENIPIKIQMSEKWVKTANITQKLKNGGYIVTLRDKFGTRHTALAMYLDGTWIINDADRYPKSEVVAYFNGIENTLEPCNSVIQNFKVGDIIVWHNEKDKNKTVMCWMIIASFDYPDDNAARAKVGKEYFSKEIQTIYTGWAPGYFPTDVRKATETEENIICEQLLEYYMNNFKLYSNNVGLKMMELDLMQFKPELYDKLTNMWIQKQEEIE